jgi:uncharacterized membrane protein
VEELVAVLALFLGLAVTVGPILAVVALVRLHRREGRLRALEAGKRPEAAPPRPVAPASRPTAVRPGAKPPVASPTPAAADPGGLDLESLIGGRWLNRVGIVALLLAAAFFLKYAFDNRWIGPVGRVAIGIVAGSALLVYARFLLKRGYTYFAEGIAGTGAGILYLSLYAAWGFYQLIPQSVAFFAMIGVTGLLGFIAMRWDSERVALLALVGGLMTPSLLYTGEDDQAILFSYLFVLNGGLLALGRMRSWRFLGPLALLGTVFYFAIWSGRYYEAAKLTSTLVIATIFFVEFTAATILRARRAAPLFPEEYLTVLVNAAWYTATLQLLLYEDHRWALTLALLALAAVHLGISRLTERESSERMLFSGLGFTLIAFSVPVRLEGSWIVVGWSVEALALVWGGFRSRSAAMRWMGLVLFAVILCSLPVLDLDATSPVVNARFGSLATVIATLTGALLLYRAHEEQVPDDEWHVTGVMAVLVNLLAVVGLSLEIWDIFGLGGHGLEARLAQQMGLSIFWTLYAVGLILFGVRKEISLLRWMGLALLGLTIFKVFFFDLSFLARVYRILSFFALGLVALIVSFLYQRRRTDGGAP